MLILIMLVLIVLVAAAASVAWFSGWVGKSSVLPEDMAVTELDRIVAEIGAHSADDQESNAVEKSAASDSEAVPVGGTTRIPEQRSEGQPDTGKKSNPVVLDALVPGLLALGVGGIEWLTPDTAAMDALSQATHTDISNAFDLHQTLAENQYSLLSEGSLTNWSGHVAEAQVAEQITAWGGSDAVSMPEASNFAGADVSIFDHDFQVKTYTDFNNIDNIHGDALIVNEDAMNIPDDALHVDFGEPFDPSILDGHDVIVAEGLTLAGADDAWESAAGLWAGGFDVGDGADVAVDALIPGIGSAIRVATSGYKRRSALQDEDLRGRALGRVARDGAYGAVGAGSGVAIGMVVGGLIDVASGGLTLGLGSMLGGMAGGMIGGAGAGAVARSEDNEKIEDAQSEVAAAVQSYGKSVDTAQARADAEWSDAVEVTDVRAAELEAIRLSQAERISTVTANDLNALSALGSEECAQLLSESTRGVEALASRERSVRARRIQADWRIRARDAQGRLADGHTPNMREVLLLVVATPGGSAQVNEWLVRRSEARSTVLAAAETLTLRLRQQALIERFNLATDLTVKKQSIQNAVVAELEAPAQRIESETSKLKEELVICGRLTRDDVSRMGTD